MQLEVGAVLEGKVTGITKFGAFVEIAPHVDGLIHVNDMSWRRVKDPAELVKVGDLVQVTVLSVDPARGRIGLSLRDVNANPWKNIPVTEGQIVTGTVVKTIDSGAFVEIAPGHDGMVHISKLENHRVEKVEDVLNLGDMTWVKFMGFDEKGRANFSRKDALKEMANQ